MQHVWREVLRANGRESRPAGSEVKSLWAITRRELKQRLEKRHERTKTIPRPLYEPAYETASLHLPSRDSLKSVFSEVRSRCGKDFPSEPIGPRS